jgi:hypothetical protein
MLSRKPHELNKQARTRKLTFALFEKIGSTKQSLVSTRSLEKKEGSVNRIGVALAAQSRCVVATLSFFYGIVPPQH